MVDETEAREAIEQLGRAERETVYRALRQETGTYRSLFLSTNRRQKMQRLGLIHRPEFEGSFIDEQECDLSPLGQAIARVLAKDCAAYRERKRMMVDAIVAFKQNLKHEGRWDGLVAEHPFLAVSPTSHSDKRLIMIYSLLGGSEIELGPNPTKPEKK